MIVWVSQHWLELFGTLFGILYIILEVKQRPSMWIIGIVTSLFYIFVFFRSKFYADMSLNMYYVVISIYGWYHWKISPQQAQGQSAELPIRRISAALAIRVIAASIILFIALAYTLLHTDSPVPYGDAFTTALSIVATWMLAHKIIEQWFFWIIINAVSMYLYWDKELYITVVLFAVYLSLAVVGYRAWHKQLSLHTQKSE